MIACTGWTYDYIDEFITLPRLNEIAEFFGEVPPVAVSAARIANGLVGAPAKPEEEDTDANFGEMLESLGVTE